MTEFPGPRTDDAEGVALLGDALRRASFTYTELEEKLGLEGPFSRDPLELPVYLRLLPPGEAFSTVTKLFLLGATLPPAEVEQALAPLTIERLEATGVVQREERGLAATIDVLPWGPFLVASDPLASDLPPTRSDYVLGVHPPSIVLAELTPREPVGRVLDLGTGCGVQALLAAEHATEVVGVDLNVRALRYAEFNAVLNGVENVRFLEGSMFDPVEGETFDLVISNPPYVVSPEAQYVFRDAGQRGDAFCEYLARTSPRFLNEGGYAVLLVSWAHGLRQDWEEPLRRWTEGLGCDVIAFYTMSQTPVPYAATWNKALRWDPVAYSEALDRWVEYDRELGIEAIGWGALAMRRRSGDDNWFVDRELTTDRLDAAGDHVIRMFAAQDYLRGPGAGDAFLDGVYRLADDHLLDQKLVIRDRTGLIRQALLRLNGGFNFELELDRPSLQLVSQLDGRTAREVVDLVVDRASPEVRDDVREAAPELLRRLVEYGFVVPDGGAAS